MSEYYSWIVSFHIMSFISWMAALFYLPRLFVYHREHSDNKGFVEVVRVQEYKLYRYIAMPAMIATVVTGLLMIAINPDLFKSGYWLHLKLFLVSVLLVYHFSLGYLMKRLLVNPTYKSGAFFRLYNEIPTLMMIAIVVLVILKPI